MALGIYEEEDIRAIAVAIRDNTSSDGFMTTKEMSQKIPIVRETGFNLGYRSGYLNGEVAGQQQGIEQGKTEANAAFEIANSDLENILYGEQRGYPVQSNMNQAKYDLNEIGTAIRESGVTPSKTTEGYAENIGEIYGAGRKSQYDEFWDIFQDNGNRTNYIRGFCGWKRAILRPKYDIIPQGDCNSIFSGVSGIADFDLWQEECEITVDFSKVQRAANAFVGSSLEKIGVIDFSNAVDINWCFSNTPKLHTIEKIILPNADAIVSSMFHYCPALENLNIEGTIGQNGVNVQWSTKLTHDSLMSIINELKDYSGTDTWMTITLGAENIAKLTQEELNMMLNKQWEYG